MVADRLRLASRRRSDHDTRAAILEIADAIESAELVHIGPPAQEEED